MLCSAYVIAWNSGVPFSFFYGKQTYHIRLSFVSILIFSSMELLTLYISLFIP